MTVLPLNDTVSYLGDSPNFRQNADVVVAVNPDGTPSGYPTSSTATLTAVASATAATPLLAANTARKGASIYNTDGNALYILLAAAGTPSATNANYVIPATTGYWEVPFGYTGAIRGAWAVDGTGSAYVTEFT